MIEIKDLKADKSYDFCHMCGGGLLAQWPKASSEMPKNKQCPTCGSTIHDISITNRLGCADCYEFFKTELKPVIAKMQNTLKHVGKSPKKKNFNVNDLEVRLSDAVKKENYEEAAIIRDEIKRLRNAEV